MKIEKGIYAYKLDFEKNQKDNIRKNIEDFYNRITLEGVEENIVLWRVNSKVYRYGSYFYTDLEGNLLFGNSFFDYAMPFSNGCALVQTRCYSPEIKTFIIDIKHHQVMQFPVDFKNVNQMLYSSLPLLDSESNKWGSYIVDTETGIWSCDIPFI